MSSYRFWDKGGVKDKANLFTTDFILTDGGKLNFLCPACRADMLVPSATIDSIAGHNFQRQKCSTISHVPGAFSVPPVQAMPERPQITAAVYVQIRQFDEWFHTHPAIKTMLSRNEDTRVLRWMSS